MGNNILNWYKFKENSNILNVEENRNLQEIEEKYDYIIFYDLKQAKAIQKLLKADGTAILVVDNKFSIANFAGSKPVWGNVYDTITKDYEKTFSKNQIEKELQSLHLNYRFYYLFPNFQQPDVIFTDQYLPTENTTKLMYHISYLPGSAVVFDELKALKQLTKDGQFSNFANSYVVEIGNIEEREPRFASFNRMRKKEYQLITSIYDDTVEKTLACEEAKEHLNHIWENTEKLRTFGFTLLEIKKENKIVSPFVQEETLDKVIAKLITDGKVEEAIHKIKDWYDVIESKLPLKHQNNCDYTPYGYIDLVFENTFYQNNQFVFFDQEWFLENIPIRFILYRAIKNLYVYNREIHTIYSLQQMLEQFQLLGQQELFEKIEKDFQDQIIDVEKVAENNASLGRLVDIHKLSLLEDYKENDKKQDAVIKSLEEDNRKKQEYIESLEKIVEENKQYIHFLKRNQRRFFRRK